MSLLNRFIPELQKVFYSSINGEIQLVKFAGDLQLHVGGLMESGAVMSRVWREGLNHLIPSTFIPKSVLILGVAGGSAAKMLSARYRGIKITGVELDPTMIQIAKEYFNVGKIPGFEIINANAVDYINETKDHWDLVLADCYLGYDIPEEFSDVKFLKKCVAITGNFLINRLYWSEHIKPTDDFETKIRRHFSVTSYRTYSNKVFLVKQK